MSAKVAKKKKLTDRMRVELACYAFKFVYDHTVTFEEDGTFGADVAYLMQAILHDGVCEWYTERGIVKMLKQADNEHPELLDYIKPPRYSQKTEVCAHRVEYWYNDLPYDPEIDIELASALETEAEERAKACIIDGMVAGELNCLYTDDGTDQFEIRGWWEIKKD